MEGAWAAAKVGSEAGVKVLTRFCLDPNHSATARKYLAEIGRENVVPPKALAGDFQAQAAFARWLAHPNELGRPPDSLEVVDHRELAWPPEGERKQLWLIKYRVKDTTGLGEDHIDCGMVGSVTFCLFSYKMAQRPPEDAYAIHCYWELTSQKLIREIEAQNGAAEHRAMLHQWRGRPLKDAGIVTVAELSPKLHYLQNTVALAAASIDGEPGWAVLDGERSTWYPKSEFPDDAPHKTVLMVHVGRRLLGFEREPDRHKFLVREQADRDPKDVHYRLRKAVG